MKKIRLVIVSMICLVATLVVSSFAWFAINGGLPSRPPQPSPPQVQYLREKLKKR